MDKYKKSVSEVCELAHRDASVYGTGYIEILSTGDMRHIPFKKIKYAKT